MPFILGDSRDVDKHIISRFEVKEWRPLDYQMCYLQTHKQKTEEVRLSSWMTNLNVPWMAN